MKCALALLVGIAVAGCGGNAPRPVSARGERASAPSTVLGTCIGAGETRLFYTGQDGRVAARSVDDGSVAWVSTARPSEARDRSRTSTPSGGEVVHCDDNVVVVSAVTRGSLRVQLLRAADGSVQQEAPAVALPEWADDESTSVSGWGERDGIGIAWHALTYWQGGYPPSEKEEAEAHHEAEGGLVLRADGTTRAISGAPQWEPPELPAPVVKRHGAATWDRRHAFYYEESDRRTHIVRIEDGAGVVTIDTVSTGMGVVYVTRRGALVAIETRDERDEGMHGHTKVLARGFKGSGELAWSAELKDVLQVDPVP